MASLWSVCPSHRIDLARSASHIRSPVAGSRGARLCRWHPLNRGTAFAVIARHRQSRQDIRMLLFRLQYWNWGWRLASWVLRIGADLNRATQAFVSLRWRCSAWSRLQMLPFLSAYPRSREDKCQRGRSAGPLGMNPGGYLISRPPHSLARASGLYHPARPRLRIGPVVRFDSVGSGDLGCTNWAR